MESNFPILVIGAMAYMAIHAYRFGLLRLEEILLAWREHEDNEPIGYQKRIKTLIGLVRTIGLTLVWVMAVVMSLEQMSLAIAPILVGAEIVRLVVEFGAQNLVRDVINGFFIILENQVRVGDVAVVNGTSGLVEAISFRTITLRDLSGTVHIFPNGTVTILANMTKNWSAYVMDIGVAYKEDTDRVTEVIRTIGHELQEDHQWEKKILEPIEIIRCGCLW